MGRSQTTRPSGPAGTGSRCSPAATSAPRRDRIAGSRSPSATSSAAPPATNAATASSGASRDASPAAQSRSSWPR
ncbi:Uncharacterised protein [Mycobacteroides abscessus]|nr:Uncharacterised protein [Mycobacteroides abscessus]